MLLILSVGIVTTGFFYSYFYFPSVTHILEQLELSSKLSAATLLYFKWFWLITVIPPVLLVLILVFHKNRKTVGTAMLIFAVCSTVLTCGVTFYIQKKFQDLSATYLEHEEVLPPGILIVDDAMQ